MMLIISDVFIYDTAVGLYKKGLNVTVVGDDADLLVILLDRVHQLFQPNVALYLSTKTSVYDIHAVANPLGTTVVPSILLLHAFTG